MPIETAEGIRVPSIGDDYALTTDLRKMAESTNVIVPVANKVARAAVAAARVAAGRPITATDPLDVDRADAAVGSTHERSIDGVNWTGPARMHVRQGAGAGLGSVRPSNTRVMLQSFPAGGSTNGSGVFHVEFEYAFAVPPNVFATTIQGSSIAPVVDSGEITVSGVNLVYPGLLGSPVIVQILAIGWIAE